MKTKLKNIFVVFPIFLFLGVFLSACHHHREKISPHKMCSDKTNTCKPQTTATVRNNICGVGLWGGLVLELENGDIVQPWAADSSYIAKLDLRDGQKININFSEIKKDNRYDNVITCLAIGEYANRIKYAVQIHCLALMQEDLVLTITADVVDWGCATVGVWDGIQFKTDKGEYLQPWELLLKIDPKAIDLKAQQQVVITYTLMKTDDRYKDKQVCPTFAALPAASAIRVHNITILKN